MDNQEIEARFLNIDLEKLKSKLRQLEAIDDGEQVLEEVIIYDPEFKWRDVDRRFMRLRRTGEKTFLTYKHHRTDLIDGAEEIEFEVGDLDKAKLLIERIGFVLFRQQEKKRHTFRLGDVVIDIDTWPRVPPYVEIEGPSENAIKIVAHNLGFDWNEAVFDNAKIILEKIYSIPVGTLRYFTFNRFE